MTTYHYSIGGGPDYTFHAAVSTGDFRFDAVGDVGDTANFSKLGDDSRQHQRRRPVVRAHGRRPDLRQRHDDRGRRPALQRRHGAGARAPRTCRPGATTSTTSPARTTCATTRAGSSCRTPQPRRGRRRLSAAATTGAGSTPAPVRFIAYPEPWTGALERLAVEGRPAHAPGTGRPEHQVHRHLRPPAGVLHRLPPGRGRRSPRSSTGSGRRYSKYVLNINGHSHDYERFQPIQGVTHVTVGAASSLSRRGPAPTRGPRCAPCTSSHLRVDVGATGLKLQAICDSSTSQEDTDVRGRQRHRRVRHRDAPGASGRDRLLRRQDEPGLQRLRATARRARRSAPSPRA